MSTFRLVPAGDSVVIAEFDDRIDDRINQQVLELAHAIESSRPASVRDVVPTYRSVAVYFDPLRADYAALSSRLLVEGRRIAESDGEAAGDRAAVAAVRIPVRYGGADGPDLGAVARFAGISEAEVVARHSGRVYRVFMMGFLPGFPYLGIVDPAIAAPRRETPRLRVPAGSVGIAGAQTGIYPSDTPGGWQVIGRTSACLFDLSRPDPFLLKPGDSVEFYEER